MIYSIPRSVINRDGTLYDQYLQTAYERMAVYHRRFNEKRPAPWTTDPTLDQFSFTNVHRELDRGTIEYIAKLLAPMVESGASDGDVVAATIAYRFFNRLDTFRHSLKGPLLAGRFDAREIEQRLRAQAGPAFTAAHMVCAYHGMPGRDKIERVCRMLETIFVHRDAIAARLRAARRPKEAFAILTSLDGIGHSTDTKCTPICSTQATDSFRGTRTLGRTSALGRRKG